MKVKMFIEAEVEIKTLIVKAKVRYWEDADVNMVPDENGDLIPCRIGDIWQPIIDIDTGIIQNWVQGTKAEIHYKVCDCCAWQILDANGNIVIKQGDGYVPDTLGYGDYIIMDIDENGKIDGWMFNIQDFKED